MKLDKALRLLQALYNKNQTVIDESVMAPDVKDWINLTVRHDSSHGVEHFTCLTVASYNSDVGTVRQLVKAGCDVRASNSYGRTPLQIACLSNVDVNSKVVFLLERDPSLCIDVGTVV